MERLPDTHRADSVSPLLVITCEHGGNRIPERFSTLFSGQGEILESHRGWDPGALNLARVLAAAFGAPLFYSTTSRLLVDLNRSPHHPRVFSTITRPLPVWERSHIMARWYHPYRRRVERRIRKGMEDGQTVIHLSIHSFTPVLDGRVRDVDIGLLYDPARPLEQSVSRRLAVSLREVISSSDDSLRIRRNRPYRGTSDGLTTCLRHSFSPGRYAGIEMEVNQRLLMGAEERRRVMSDILSRAVRLAIFG